MWIGQTILFHWMERTFVPSDDPKKTNIAGELWMVHGGGFYLVEKQKWPERSPKTLHWFKWEAMMTWITGMFLLMIVYWAGPSLLGYGSEYTKAQGIGMSVAVLIGGFIGYRAIWRSPLKDYPVAGAVLSWLAVTVLACGLTKVFSDRAAVIHIGAMFGTIMVSNVWMTIIPNQRKMIKITEEGGEPQQDLAKQSKLCSTHNTYMTVPLIFTMIASHYPTITYGTEHGWAILSGLILVGFFGAWIIKEKL